MSLSVEAVQDPPRGNSDDKPQRLYLFSYFARDILWLRSLTVVAALCLVAYFYLRPEPLLTVVLWNLFFVALNILQIGRLVIERWPEFFKQDAQDHIPASL
jgi:hypothetical protein